MPTDLVSEDRSFAPAPAASEAVRVSVPIPSSDAIVALAAAHRDLCELYEILLEDADARAERYLGLMAETGDFEAATGAQREALRFVCGVAEAEKRAEEAAAMLAELEERLFAAPAITYDDLRLKALVVQKALEAQSDHIDLDSTQALRCLVRDITGAATA